MLSYRSEISRKIRKYGLLLITVATSFSTYAPERTDEDVDLILDELFFSEQQFLDEMLQSGISQDFIYTSFSWNSNTFFSGRSAGVNQFNFIPQITYFNTSGFNATLSGIYYESFTPRWDFTSLSLSYFKTLGKQNTVFYNIGYTRYFFTEDVSTFTNSLDLNIGITDAKRTIGTSLSSSYLFGDSNSFQLVSNSFLNFNLERTSNMAIRFRPNVSFIIAQQSISFVRRQLVNGQPQLLLFTNNIFDLLNTQISFPLSLTTNSWDFEVGYSLNIPNPVVNESNLPNTNFFSLSIGYMFGL